MINVEVFRQENGDIACSITMEFKETISNSRGDVEASKILLRRAKSFIASLKKDYNIVEDGEVAITNHLLLE